MSTVTAVPDIIVANSGADDISVFLNKGDGTFSSPISYPMNTGSAPYSVAVADINGDSNRDIIVANSGTDNVGVLLNKGNGTFSAKATYSTNPGSSPRSVAVADVNGDGRVDIVVANTIADNIGVLLNAGNGIFSTPVTYATGNGSAPSAVAVGDINADGKTDIIVANHGSDNVGVFFSSVSGKFSAQKTYSTGKGSSPSSVAVADVNTDGTFDIIVANYGSDSVGVFFAC